MAFNVARKKKVILGGGTPPVEDFVLNNDFETFTLANPMTVANYRTMVGHPTITPVLTYLSVQDTGSPHGKVVTWTSPANTVGTNQNGGIGATSNLPEFFDHGYIEFYIRFRSGFEWSLGGKIPGLGGFTPGAPIASSPSGGNPHWFGWGGRMMWHPNGGLGGYMYMPWLSYNTFGTSRSSSIDFTSLPGGTHSDGQWFKIRHEYKMNTVVNDKLAADAAIWNAADAAGTLATAQESVVQGTDYLADGIHRIYVNDALGYEKTNEVFQYYPNPTGGIKVIQWSQFRGGQGSTWASSTTGYCDIANIKVVKIA